ncbi:lamin tail domain-containing protein [bacterium]|nr:lamin tail domain-containing protein [bacterium]
MNQLPRLFAFLLLLFFRSDAFADIIITEIMYNPSGPESANEYIELYNTGPERMPLNGYTISDGTGTDELVRYNGDGSTFYLDAEDYAVILDPDYWDQDSLWYDEVMPWYTLLLTVEDAALGSGGLGNSNSETITLRNPSQLVESSRTYQPGAPGGSSEERIDLAGGEGDGNWAFSEAGGSPGIFNTVGLPDYDVAVDTLIITPPPGEQGIYSARFRVRNRGRMECDYRMELTLYHRYHDRYYTRDERLVMSQRDTLSSGDTLWVEQNLDLDDSGKWSIAVNVFFSGDQNYDNNQRSVDYWLAYPEGSVRIAEIMADPGTEHIAEWVELANRYPAAENPDSTRNIELKGWSLRDAQGITMQIDSSSQRYLHSTYGTERRFVLANDEKIEEWDTIDSYSVLVQTPFPSLNNNGDSLYLVDPTGRVIDSIEYGPAIRGRSWVRDDLDGPAGVDGWSLSTAEAGGTPGIPEAPRDTMVDLSIDSLWWEMGRGYEAVAKQGDSREMSGGYDVPFLYARVRHNSIPSDIERVQVRLSWSMIGLPPEEQSEHVEFVEIPLPPANGSDTVSVEYWHGSFGAIRFTAELQVEDQDEGNNLRVGELYIPWYYGGGLRVNEVMANPGAQSGGEWVELISSYHQGVNVDGWQLEDAAGNRTLISQPDTLRLFDEYLVLAEERDAFLVRWPDVDPAIVFACESWAKLNDSGDAIRLLDPTGSLLDSIGFGTSRPGQSLISESHWNISSSEEGGSPGEANNWTPPTGPEGSDFSLTLSPNPFSPDGDGYEDLMEFFFTIPDGGGRVTLILFDVRGREVGMLLENKWVQTGVPYIWDGRRGLHVPRLKTGMYVYLATLENEPGRATIKGTLVVAGSR